MRKHNAMLTPLIGTNPSSTTAAWLTKYSATYDFKEVAGGASDNNINIYNNQYAVVNGGAGNDTLMGGGLLYGGEGRMRWRLIAANDETTHVWGIAA